MSNGYIKKKNARKTENKYRHFPVANLQLLQNLTKKIMYHEE